MGFKMKGFPMHKSASALKQATQASPFNKLDTYPTEFAGTGAFSEVTTPVGKIYKDYNKIKRQFEIGGGTTVPGADHYTNIEDFLKDYPSGDAWNAEAKGKTFGGESEWEFGEESDPRFQKAGEEGETIPFEEGYQTLVGKYMEKGMAPSIDNLSTIFSDTEGSPDLTNAIEKLKEENKISDEEYNHLMREKEMIKN